MSDLLYPASGRTPIDPRRRASLVFLALALAAALVVVVSIFLVGNSGDGRRGRQAAGTDLPTQSAAPTQSAPPTQSGPATSATRRATSPSSSVARSTSQPPTAVRPVPTSTANPCPSAQPCVVSGDAGQVVAALNAYRVSHAGAAVPGAVSPPAQQCALSQGDGASCKPSYAWEPVPTQDGARVISMIAGRGDGQKWLLDPGMKSFSVGWAYIPGAGGRPGQYQCAVLKFG